MTTRIKYPRTYHLPWSPGATSDDKILSTKDVERLSSLDVVVTEKMDGENTTIYADDIHARSLDSAHHPSRTWVKALQGQIGHNIPKGWRICGENLYALHSVAYENLSSYFLVFNIWPSETGCLSWTETVEWCQLLDLEHVPVIYHGQFNKEKIHETWLEKTSDHISEGYVVRFSGQINYNDWPNYVGKWVRKNHVQTDEHWMSKEIISNKLKEQK